ncbi:MAG: imidazoleglycerol-phosphate dehydratase HisB [Alphaproteobacteria bacterium]|nr:imidazoleglycerol-phosphate dehydratase HisB [Alphaproteobacteria bacterium]
MRQVQIERNTTETQITVQLNLDGTGIYNIQTGCGFFDHMLEQLSRHSLIDLTIQATGDLHIDAHHLVEDTGIVLGKALLEALADKTGINRYGSACIPMDEALTRCVLDLSGRTAFVWHVKFPTEKVGDIDTEVFKEFFAAVADNLKAAIHIENLYGDNSHHIAESCFKAFARALRHAVEIDPKAANITPSTKGAL